MKKTVNEKWVVQESQRFSELNLGPDAQLEAPAGKRLTMTVDGVGLPMEPGRYTGDVRLTLTDEFVVRTVRFGEVTDASYRMGVCMKDGHCLPACSVQSAVRGGEVRDGYVSGVAIDSREWDFNGIYVTGSGEYVVDDVRIELEGDGTDDFVGLGAAIAASGDAKLTINRAAIHTKGITRGALFAGGNSRVTVNDSELSLVSYVPSAEQLEAGKKLQRMMEPPWSMSIRGNGRTTNLAECGQLTLNRCHVTSNSWGVLSVDGARVNRMYVRDSKIELLGESGYGAFSIADDLCYDYAGFGDWGCMDVFDHSEIRVPTYGIIMSLGTAGGEFKNGSRLYSGRHGAFIFRNCGILKVNSGAAFYTKGCSFLVKGSNVRIEADDAILEPENGVILRLMDNDDTGMEGFPFIVPVGVEDPKEESRDLFHAQADEDVFFSLSDMTAAGDIFNSTTNIKACMNVPPKPADAPPPPDPGQIRGFIGDGLQGAKNLDIKLTHAVLKGRISSAKAAYAPGVTLITKENCEELGEITETPSHAVNNGVIVHMDGRSVWTVTGSCFLTSLTLEEGSSIQAPEGKKLALWVDGNRCEIEAGTYQGAIELRVE